MEITDMVGDIHRPWRASPETSPGSALVRFAGVKQSYDGETLVIKELDLDIARGEFLTLLGPSGSGKTTSLMLLAGFITPTFGTISLNGRSLNAVPPHKRGIGMVFQDYALFPHMNVAQNVSYPLRVRGIAKEETRAKTNATLEMVGLAGFNERYPAQLSGGQQQRVALARALVFEPELVLMDEPLGALDRQLREKMQFEIKRLHQKLGVTVVYVTHDQAEALAMSDRIAVFHDGKIQQIGTPERIYDNPENEFVAGFIGENNILRGTVDTVQGPLCSVSLDDGTRVWARAVGVETEGTRAVISIRPEQIKINDISSNDKNSFHARVSEKMHFGDHIRIHVIFSDNVNLVVKLSPLAFSGQINSGDSIKISWETSACRALESE